MENEKYSDKVIGDTDRILSDVELENVTAGVSLRVHEYEEEKLLTGEKREVDGRFTPTSGRDKFTSTRSSNKFTPTKYY